jgi:hypothetical protein
VFTVNTIRLFLVGDGSCSGQVEPARDGVPYLCKSQILGLWRPAFALRPQVCQEEFYRGEVCDQYRTYIKEYSDTIKAMKDNNAEQAVAEAIQAKEIAKLDDCM